MNISTVAIGAWLYAISRKELRGLDGFRLWTFANLLQVSGWLLLSLHFTAQSIYANLLAPILIIIANLFYLYAFNRLLVKQARLIGYSILTFCAVAIAAYLDFILINIPARFAILSIAAAILFFKMGQLLIFHPRELGIFRIRYWGYLLILFTLGLLARAVYFAIKISDQDFHVFENNGFQQWMHLMLFIAAFIPAFIFLIVAIENYSQRFRKEESIAKNVTAELISKDRTLDNLLHSLNGMAYRCRNDADWTITYASDGCLDLTGYPPQDFIESKARNFRSLIHPDDVETIWDRCEDELQTSRRTSNEYRIVTASNEIRWVWDQAYGLLGDDGKLVGIEGFITDITEKKTASENLKKINSLYNVITQSNQAIFRLTTKPQLFSEIVRICVECGKFDLAWIGTDDRETGWVQVDYVYGSASGYAQELKVSSRPDIPEGQGPTGIALRDGKIVIVNEWTTKDDPWALKRAEWNIHASMSLPLFENSKSAAVLTLYSCEKGFFTGDRVALLSELANDVSYALDRFESEYQRRTAEASLLKAQILLEQTGKLAMVGGWELQPSNEVLIFSTMAAEILEINSNQHINLESFLELFYCQVERDRITQLIQSAIQQDKSFEAEVEIKTPKGTKKWISLAAQSAIADKTTNRVFGSIQDITQKKIAEQKLIQNETLLNFAIDSTSDAVWDLDILRNEVTFSKRWQEMLGYEPGELENSLATWNRLIHPHDFDQIQEKRKNYLAGETMIYENLQRLLGKSGSYHWVTVRGITVERDPEGKPIRIVGTLKNIDAEVTRELEAEKQHEILQAVYENSPVGMTLIRRNNEIVKKNPALDKIYATNTEALPRSMQTLKRYFKTDGSQYLPHDLPAARAFDKKTTIEREIIGIEGDDKAITWIIVSACYIHKFDLVLEISNDITELKRKESELAMSEIKFRSLFESLPVGVALLNADHKIIENNTTLASQFDLSASTVNSQGNIQADWIQKTQFENHALAKSTIQQESIPVKNSIIGYDDNGKKRWFDVSIYPIPELQLFAQISNEITDLVNARRETEDLNRTLEKRVEERTRELEVLNKELESFSYSVSHDLRAPLMRINSWSQALLEDFQHELGEKGQNYISYLREEIKRMEQLISGMLSLSKASTTDMALSKVDLSTMAKKTLTDLVQAWPNKIIHQNVTVNLKADADPVLMEILLTNLLQNAVKFSSKKDEIYIEFGCTTKNSHTVYFVKDQGAGFNPQYSTHLFAPFQRMHQEKDFPGSGIGLATAQRIVHRHKGRIWAETSLGVGTTIFFTLHEFTPTEDLSNETTA